MRPPAGAEVRPTPSAGFARLPAGGAAYLSPRAFFDRHPRLLDYAAAARALRLEAVSFLWLADRLDPLRVRITVVDSADEQSAAVELSATPAHLPGGLTSRELQLLTLVVGGLTNPDIADRLGVSRRTVATHVERILAKLGVATRTGAATFAVEQRLLVLPVPGGPQGVVPLDVVRLDLAAAERPVGLPMRSTRRRARGGERPLLVGGLYPTGPAAADGRHMLLGARLAVEEINARGGAAGREIVQLPVEADVTSAASVAAAIDTLLAHEVDALTLGYTFAREDLGALFAGVADYGCPVLHSQTSRDAARLVAEEPTRFGSVFQVCAPEDRYGPGFIRTLGELEAAGSWAPHNRRLVVIDTTSPQLTTFPPGTYAAAERAGWTISALERVSPVQPEWDTALRRIAELEPAAVMVACFVETGLVDLLRRFRADPTPSLLYALYAPSLPGFQERTGGLAEGLLWATVIGLYDDRRAAGFSQRFRARFAMAPSRSSSGIHYDMVRILADAWSRATSSRDFRDVSSRLREAIHRGVNGAYCFDHPGQSALAYPDDTPDPSLGQAHLVHQVQGGRSRIIAPAPYASATFNLPPWLNPALGDSPSAPMAEDRIASCSGRCASPPRLASIGRADTQQREPAAPATAVDPGP